MLKSVMLALWLLMLAEVVAGENVVSPVGSLVFPPGWVAWWNISDGLQNDGPGVRAHHWVSPSLLIATYCSVNNSLVQLTSHDCNGLQLSTVDFVQSVGNNVVPAGTFVMDDNHVVFINLHYESTSSVLVAQKFLVDQATGKFMLVKETRRVYPLNSYAFFDADDTYGKQTGAGGFLYGFEFNSSDQNATSKYYVESILVLDIDSMTFSLGPQMDFSSGCQDFSLLVSPKADLMAFLCFKQQALNNSYVVIADAIVYQLPSFTAVSKRQFTSGVPAVNPNQIPPNFSLFLLPQHGEAMVMQSRADSFSMDVFHTNILTGVDGPSVRVKYPNLDREDGALWEGFWNNATQSIFFLNDLNTNNDGNDLLDMWQVQASNSPPVVTITKGIDPSLGDDFSFSTRGRDFSIGTRFWSQIDMFQVR